MFYSDLVKQIRHYHTSEFIKLKSYKGTESTGEVNISDAPKP